MELFVQIIAILFVFVLTILIFNKNNIISFNKNSNNFILKNKKSLILLSMFFIFFLTKILFIDKIPYGLNLDEASAGYDAYNLLNYGVDRHMQSFPVYLTAWGGGQNALYTYILIPFINLLGLTIFSVRLPMAIISSISMIYLFLIFKNRYGLNYKKLFLVLLFIGTIPYLLMKSRWGLESNLLPEIFILIYYNLDKYLINKNKLNFYTGFILIGISCYTYATTFMFMPLFVISMFIYFVINKKEIEMNTFLIGFIIVLLITLPLVLFVIINMFGFDGLSIGPMTIPLLHQNRMSNMIILNPFRNLILSFIFIFTTIDVVIANKMFNSFIFSYISYTIIIISFIYKIFIYFKNKQNLSKRYDLFKCLIIPSFFLVSFCNPNVNRLNIVITVIIIFSGFMFVDFFDVILKNKKQLVVILVLFLSFDFLFCIYRYINIYNEPHDTNFNMVLYEKSKETIKNNKSIYYYGDNFNCYIYYLFGSKLSPEILNKNYKKDSEIFFEDYPYININNRYFFNQPLIIDKNNIYIFEENKNSKKQLEKLENMLKNKSLKYIIKEIDECIIIET